MSSNTISEARFLLTELRYTLGQVHVQVLDVDQEERKSSAGGERSIDMILRDLLRAEQEWQGRYHEILGTAPREDAAQEPIPLPVHETEGQPGLENAFEHARARTIALLEPVDEPWSQSLLDAVKQQVQQDRQYTTDIAECRRRLWGRDQRPDLDEPLKPS
ncbi:MAG: hypothetical protein ACR2GA_05070 [Chloroflexota bacterium]